MEIDGLGSRCHLSTCRAIDYLPITCPYCTRHFCREHQAPTSHHCPHAPQSKVQVPTCPLCNSPVPIPPNLTADQAVSRHIDAGCPKRARTNPVCAKPGCNKRDVVSTKCPACNLVFCLEHRLEMDHQCQARSSNPAQTPFGQRILPTPAKPAPAKPKRSRGDVQIHFINTASQPIGNAAVDTADRLTVAVFFPMGTAVRPRHMFFSLRNSAGKIIDGLLRDVNGLNKPSNGARLCLYAVKRGGGGVNLLPHITPLKDLPTGTIANGDILVLEQGNAGLDQAWFDVLAKVHANRSIPARRGLRMAAGKRGARAKSEKCAVS